MPNHILRNIHMLEVGSFILPLLYAGCSVFASQLSTSPTSQSKFDQILGTGYKHYPGSLKSIVDLPNRRKLLSTAPKNESNTVKDDSIGGKIREFYADDNNMALFCILPLLIFVYGGCSVIYCVHKCKKNLKKRKHDRQHKARAQTAISTGDNVSLISGTDMAAAKPKRNIRPFSGCNRVAPAPPYEVTNTNNLSEKLKMDTNGHVKDLLTDYEFFASWVMAQKAADLIQLQGENAHSDSSVSGAESMPMNCGTTTGGRKKKLVFLS